MSSSDKVAINPTGTSTETEDKEETPNNEDTAQSPRQQEQEDASVLVEAVEAVDTIETVEAVKGPLEQAIAAQLQGRSPPPPTKAASASTPKPSASSVAAKAATATAKASSTCKTYDAGIFIRSHPEFQLAKARLMERIPFFQKHPLTHVKRLKYYKIPEEYIDTLDWDDGAIVTKVFPNFGRGKSFGARQVPICFLRDAETIQEKLVVVNWWRGLTPDEQKELKWDMSCMYRAPTRSNSPLQLFHQNPADFLKPRQATIQQQQQQPPPPPPPEKFISTTTSSTSSTQTQPPQKTKPPPLCFRSMQSCQELAIRLELDVDALYCATIEPSGCCCVIENCQYPAIAHNRTHCAIHRRGWWPTSVGMEVHTKRRGHMLLGLPYAHRLKLCCSCSQPTCEAIGWSEHLTLIPRKHPLPNEIVVAPHHHKDRPVRLAPWHWAPAHRRQWPDGTWKVNFGKGDAIPPPAYDLDDFLQEPGMVGYQEQTNPDSSSGLPTWVEEYRRKEYGPEEYHVDQLQRIRQERDAFQEQLVAEMEEYQALALQHRALQRTHDEMKVTHIRRRKRRKKSHHKKSHKKKKPSTHITANNISTISTTIPAKRRRVETTVTTTATTNNSHRTPRMAAVHTPPPSSDDDDSESSEDENDIDQAQQEAQAMNLVVQPHQVPALRDGTALHDAQAEAISFLQQNQHSAFFHPIHHHHPFPQDPGAVIRGRWPSSSTNNGFR
jgi:hypothetical protein